jgi:hypothetical protein
LLAFMHGRHDIRFTPAEQTQLRGYLEDGGSGKSGWRQAGVWLKQCDPLALRRSR